MQLFVQCGMCKVRMPVDVNDDPRDLLRAHFYCEHGAHLDDLEASGRLT